MYTDAKTTFSEAQAITADAPSTNHYNFGATGDAGVGGPLKVIGSIDESFNTLTSLNIIAECDDNSSFSSAKTLYSVPFLLAALTAGSPINLPDIPEGCEQYLRFRYDVVGTNPTTGKITIRLALDKQNNVPTANGI